MKFTDADYYESKQQCAWCGGLNTRFKHFECWEDDKQGNHETTQTQADEDCTPRDAIYFCSSCGDYFSIGVAQENEGE